jgi:hypothetical protein
MGSAVDLVLTALCDLAVRHPDASSRRGIAVKHRREAGVVLAPTAPPVDVVAVDVVQQLLPLPGEGNEEIILR